MSAGYAAYSGNSNARRAGVVLKTKYKALRNWVFGAIVTLMALLVIGFFVFATIVAGTTQDVPERADGIVVLTGGSERIAAAARLLRNRRAKWLLISGVNKNTSEADILRLSKLDRRLFACCVTLGYIAQDTKGNALEARAWQRGNRLNSLIIVTAAYHMPRSMVELSLQMPKIKLVPYSVVPKRFRGQPWWLKPANAQFLAREYIKFLPAAAQFAVSRLLKFTEPNAEDGTGLSPAHHAATAS